MEISDSEAITGTWWCPLMVSWKRRGVKLLIIFLFIRLLLVGITILEPEGGILIDSGGYIGLRNRLIETGMYANLTGSTQDLNWPPGYPVFLVLSNMIVESSLMFVTLIQLGLSGALCIIVLYWGERSKLFESGLIGAWILALSPNLVLWSLTIMSEVLFAALVVCAFAVFLGWSKGDLIWRAAISGALLALAAYVRPIALLLMPAWLICIGAVIWPKTRMKISLQTISVFLLSFALIVLPWIFRNKLVHERTVFSTVGAKTLVNFNLAEVLADAEGVSRNRAAAEFGEGEHPLELMWQLATDYPIPFMKNQAFGFLRIALGTDIGTWGNVLGWDDWTGFGILSRLFGRAELVTPGRPTSVVERSLRYFLLAYSILHAAILMGLASIGFWSWPRARTSLLFWLPLVTIIILLIAPGASGQARFRVPVEPFLALFAGIGGIRFLGLIPFDFGGLSIRSSRD